MLTRRLHAPFALLTLLVPLTPLTVGGTARAQQPAAGAPPDTGRRPAAAAPATPAPSVAMSGVIYGNYQYNTAQPNREANQFLLDRVYLTARATLGHGVGARVTTDVFQAGDANGWTIRLKYGYLQHDAKAAGWTASTRAGMLQTVVIEHIESFWPRFLGNTPTDRNGYFASADVGVAELLTLPGKWGEVYSTVVNGPGFSRRENDRFKDVALRVSLTPLAARNTGILSTLTVTGWFYEGAQASRFVNGGADQLRAVHEGLRKDRRGAFIGVRDPRLVAGLEYAARDDGVETGANTIADPRVAGEVSGRIRSAFAIVRPIAFASDSGRSRLGVVGRFDDVRPGTTRAFDVAGEEFHYLVAGLIWDATPRLSLALDYQEQIARRKLVPDAKTYFAHFGLTF